MPRPFNFFASSINYLFETNDTFEGVVRMFYYSLDANDRIELLEFLQNLLKPEIDPVRIDGIWDKAGGSIGFQTPQETVNFLQSVQSICDAYQREIEGKAPAIP